MQIYLQFKQKHSSSCNFIYHKEKKEVEKPTTTALNFIKIYFWNWWRKLVLFVILHTNFIMFNKKSLDFPKNIWIKYLLKQMQERICSFYSLKGYCIKKNKYFHWSLLFSTLNLEHIRRKFWNWTWILILFEKLPFKTLFLNIISIPNKLCLFVLNKPFI